MRRTRRVEGRGNRETTFEERKKMTSVDCGVQGMRTVYCCGPIWPSIKGLNVCGEDRQGSRLMSFINGPSKSI